MRRPSARSIEPGIGIPQPSEGQTLMLECKVSKREKGSQNVDVSWRGILATVRLTSTGNPVPGNQELYLAPSETIVEQVCRKNKKSRSGHSLMMTT